VAITGGGTGVTYTPNADYCGADTFTYTITGGSIGTVSVTVTCVDDNPVAVNDAATVAEDSGATTIDVLANDTDVDAGPKLITGVTQGTNGTVAITGGGTALTYTPNANYNGADSFTYTITGGSTATVTMTVTAVDDPPTAVNDAVTVNEDSGATTINVLANDTDIDLGPKTITGVTQGTNGAVVNNGTDLTYTPNPNFNGSDSFTYTLNGGSTATVNVTVTSIPDAPSVANDAATVNEDLQAPIDVLANDPDPDNFGKSITSVTQGTNGTVVITGGGTGLTYTPNADYCGGDTFTYTINGTPALTATVTVTVTCVNDAPSFTTGGDVSAAEDTPYNAAWATGLSVGPANEAGQTLNFVIDTNTNPTLFSSGPTILPDGTLQYTPAANANGFADITVHLHDDGGTANGGVDSSGPVSFKITVTSVNDNPTANTDVATVNEDSAPNTINVLANDSILPDSGETLTITGVTQGTNGAVSFTAGDVSYTPNVNFFGSDSFTYTISDGNGGTAIGTVNVTVTPINDPPLNTVPGAQSVNQNVTLVFSSGNGNAISIADIDGVAPQVTLGVTNGDLTLSGITGLSFTVGDGTNDATMTFTGAIADINNALQGLIYTPVNTFAGGVTLTITTNDLGQTGGGNLTDVDPVAITVNDANDAPVNALPAAQNVNEDSTLTLSTANSNAISISDLDAGGASVQVQLTVTNGTLTLSGTTGLAFSFSDANGTGAGDGTADATMTFRGTIAAINTALNGLVYTPTPNTSGPDTLTIVTNDLGNTGFGGPQSDTDILNITVNGANDAPVNTVPGGQSINEDANLTFPGSISVADDAGTNPVQITLTVTNGTLSLSSLSGLSFVFSDANGTGAGDGSSDATMTFRGTLTDVNAALNGLLYVPNANYSGSDTLTITTNDLGNSGVGGALTDSDPIAITISAVNDAPLGTDNSVTLLEDAQYTFTVADFGFSDPNDTPANVLQSVVISTLPATGALQLSGAGFAAGTAILATDINAGNLKFVPAVNGSGTPYASFTFRVRDNGGTANGGVDTDPVANTMTVNVTPVNDAPAGTNKTIAANEDAQYTFTVADFGFTDPNDTPANTLQSVVITTLPGAGSLTLSGSGFAAGTEVAVADITAGNLKFAAAANANGAPYTTFTFQVRDNGGTANSGVDLDASANTITFNVTGVNDMPAGTDGFVVTDEDVQFTFTAANFGFTDPNDTPANALQSVVITTLPGAGSLTLSGAGFAAGTEIPVASITAGNLKFLSAANAFGTPYTSFTFQVRDNGGTANGGVDLDSTPNTLTINVNPVNDAPVMTDSTLDYTALGNTQLRVGEATTGNSVAFIRDNLDVLEKSAPTDIDGPGPIQAVAQSITTANGGNFVLNADGTFTYESAAGFTGTDVINFQLTDNGAPAAFASGTITITVNETVWYVRDVVDADNPAAGDTGRSTNAFEVLGDAGVAATPNDYIFVFAGNTAVTPLDGGIRINDAGVKLHGEGIGLTVPGFGTLIPAGAKPVIVNTVDVPAQEDRGVFIDATAGAMTGVEVRGLNISGRDNAIDLTATGGNAAGVLISDNTITSAALEGIDINAGSTALVTATINNNTVTSIGNAIDVRNNAGSSQVAVSTNNILQTNGMGINLDGSGGGAMTITALTGNTVSGNVNGGGIAVSFATFDATPGSPFQTVSGGNTFVGASGNPVGGIGVSLSAVSGDISFTDLESYAGNGLAMRFDGTGVFVPSTSGARLTVTSGTGIFNSTNGYALTCQSATCDVQNASFTSANSTTNGIAVVNAAGSITGSGALTNATGTDISISGSNVTFTFSGTTYDNAGQLVNMSSNTGGTYTFSGAIDDLDGTSDPVGGGAANNGGGISLTGNTGTTINFSGGMQLSTGATAAFAATGGGTLNVTGTNVVSTTTGTAVNIANTTIGASNATFQSVSANGAANGIVISTTGSGRFIVSGTGAASSGGTLQNITGAAISLTSTNHPAFSFMNLQNIGANGVDGQQVTDFTFTNNTVNNVGTAATGQYNESNIAFNDGGVFTASSVSGIVTITGNTLTNARRHGIDIENGTGTISNLVIQNNTLTSSTSAATSLGTAILVASQGSAATVSNITTGTISGNTISNFPSGEGIAVLGGAGNSTNNTSSTIGANATPINITGNFINGGATRMGSNAIRATFNGQVGVLNVNITNNGSAASPITNIQGQGISGFIGGSVTGTMTINNNRIVANQTLLAGTHGLAVQVDDGPAGLGTSAADYNVIITNNNISNYEGNGIRAIARASLGKMDVTIQNNTVSAPIMTNRNGIRVDSGSAAGDVSVCMLMTGNTSAGSGVNQGIGLRKQGSVATTNDFGISGLAPSPATAATAAAKVVADNPAGGGVDIISGNNFVSCTPN
jgi:hypothetical protein